MNERLKDRLRFISGLLVLGYETVIEKADRPWLIVAAIGLMGYSGITKLGKLLD